jgi:hypothetical protein
MTHFDWGRITSESKMSDSDECMKYGGLRDKQI